MTKKTTKKNYLHHELATTLRILSIEMIEEAKSGHPGIAMGFADVITVLFRYFFKFYPKDPNWPDRDRFILSAGHGSALLYSLLFLVGYEGYKLADLRKFRQLGSKTHGHPELAINLGIEATTGPLGQGLANAVGMAISGKKLQSKLQSSISHKIYVVVGDGCMMEGISHEAMSLAGHLRLNNLVVLFDDNKISIDGMTSLTNSDMHLARVSSYNWNVISIDGHNPNTIWQALQSTQKSNKPIFVACRTKIGYGSPNFENSSESHGKPFKNKEIFLIKQKLRWKHKKFSIPQNFLKIWRSFYQRNMANYLYWKQHYNQQYKKYQDQKNDLSNVFTKIKELKQELILYNYNQPTRESSHKIICNIIPIMPNLIGGSADLSSSNGTKYDKQKVVTRDNFSGQYIHYGVREHAMVAIMNAISIHGQFRVYGGTFLVFSDYCRPAIRLASLMKLPVIMIFTHDSIGLGEDGPTHQPIEHLTSLRAIPNINVYRPADAIETLECWELILKQTHSPAILCLSKQSVPQLRSRLYINEKKNLVQLGAYIIYQSKHKSIISIFASGSELSIAINVAKRLDTKMIGSTVISVPCHELLWQQHIKYRTSILCNKNLKVAIEAGSQQSWNKIIGPHGIFFGIDTFGKSGKSSTLYKYFQLTVKEITLKILQKINR